MKKSVICISGGLDSYGLYRYLLKQNLVEPKNLTLLYVDLGQPYFNKEMNSIKRLYPDELVKVVTVKNFVTKKVTPEDFIIPARNMLIATLAVSYGEHIYFGGIADENHSSMFDKNTKFFEELTKTLSSALGKTIIVESPFFIMKWNKPDILKFLIDENDYKFNLTTSCYHPKYRKCGECFVCAKRWLAEEYVLIERPYLRDKFFPFKKKINPFTNKYFREFIDYYYQAYNFGNFEHFHKNRIMKDSIVLVKKMYELYDKEESKNETRSSK